MQEKNKIFVGGIPAEVEDLSALKERAAQFGTITDSFKPVGKGFAFITFETEEQAQAAIEAMNGQPLEEGGAPLTVNLARPKTDRPRNFGDRRGGGGGYGRRDGGGFRRRDEGGFGGGRRDEGNFNDGGYSNAA